MLSSKMLTLLSAAQTLNFTKTAQELSLTQPAVSQHIRALEDELGIKIFVRVNKEMLLTDEGKIAVEYAKKMHSIYFNLKRELENEKKHLRQMTVGVTPSAEENYVSEALAMYCSKNPGTHITIITESIKNLYDKLLSYEVDIAIIEGAITHPELSAMLLDTDYLVAAIPNGNALAGKKSITLSELKKQPLILRLPNSGTRTLFENSLLQQGESIENFNIILEVDNNRTIKELVKSGFGVSVISKSTSSDFIRKKKFKAATIEELHMLREINLVYHKDFRHTQVLEDIEIQYNEAVRRELMKAGK